MATVEYVEVRCKSALNRVHGMPFAWSLNPYAGCVHACVYCYARSHYALAGHGEPTREFETRILVKTNLPEVLRRELRRPGWRFEMVALGTVTDCYQPAEGRFRLTRAALEALSEVANPLGLVTKSPLVLRDMDILAALARQARVRIFFTVTTVDLSIWRTLEPGTANPYKRLAVMRRLNEAGIPAGVLMAPILPGITDSVESIEGVARAAAEHGAAFFGTSALRLKPVVREGYFEFVGAQYPELLERYQRAYFGTNPPAAYQAALDERVDRIRAAYDFVGDSMRTRRGEDEFERVIRTTEARPPARVGPQLVLPL